MYDLFAYGMQMGKTQLSKGDYTIRVFLRHDNVPLLEKLKDKVCVVERELEQKISVPIYSSNSDSIKAANALKDTTLFPGMLTSGLEPLASPWILLVGASFPSGMCECSTSGSSSLKLTALLHL